MVVWTPTEWKKEINEFAAAVRQKRHERVPYEYWVTMNDWTRRDSNVTIVLAIQSTQFIVSDTQRHTAVNLSRYSMKSFLDFLENKYYDLYGYVVTSKEQKASDLTKYIKMGSINSNYATATCNTAVNNAYSTATDWVYDNGSSLTGYPIGAYSSYDTIQSEVDRLRTQLETIKVKTSENKEEKKDMNFFKNFEFGPVKNDTVRLSPYGLAVKNLNGSWVSYDGSSDSIINVDVFNFESKNLIYKIPVVPTSIKTGDIIVHQGKAMCVVADVCEGDTCASVIDPRAGESKEILFCRSPFGFTFVTKLVSLLDMSGIDANPDNPFGNMWPLALMGDKDCDAATMMAFMMISNGGDCQFDMSNPMMMYALMSQSGSDNNLLPMLMLMGCRK